MVKTLFFFFFATALFAATGWAEPIFLAKQYTRCTACHYSPTGGGLLTPYGRLLSHRELSTSGPAETAADADAEDGRHGEQAFLYGAFGNALGPVRLGLEMRPTHLRVDYPGGHQDMNLQMALDLVGAVQKNGWTAYASAGREPPNSAVRNGRMLADPAFISYEHWISHQVDDGLRIRAGRFLPAYGVRFADHSTYSRVDLDLDRNDQVYGLEVSDTIGPSLIQVMISPGKAESILHDPDHRGSSTAARWQFDLAPRATIVGSAFYRDATRSDPRSGAVGAAFGMAPTAHVSVWTEVDANLQAKALGGRSWLVVNETSVEVHRGIWLKFSPQLRTSGGVAGDSSLRLAFAADLLPRTHWNVNLGYYFEQRFDAGSTSTLLAQLHLYM
ncbi:MAG: hypothetical protein ABI665_08925 [Vicinamibacterales bacterium]